MSSIKVPSNPDLRPRRLSLALGAIALGALFGAACSSGDHVSNNAGTAGTTGSGAGQAGTTGSGGSSSGSAGTTGSGGSSSGSAGTSGPGTGGSGTAGAGGSSTGGGGRGGTTGSGGSSSGSAGTSGPGTGGSGTPGTGGSATGGGGSAGGGGRGGVGGVTGTAGSSAAGRGGAGGTVGTGGSGTAGTGPAGASGTAGTTGTSSKEDDGTDCTVATLPASSSLPTITLLPDPFKKLDGTEMTTKAEWRCRREEIRKMEEKYVYGTKPQPPQSVTGTVSSSMISVSVMDGGKSASFTAGVKLPTSGSAPYPVVIEYASDTSGTFGPPLDSGVLNSEGVAVIYFNAYAVGAEGNGHGTNQSGAFYSLYAGGSATGLLTAWGWGVSRIIDVLEKSGGSMFDASAVAVSGCSRFGKGAFIAGVIDQRVALTLPIESGTAGVPIWRGIAKGEKGENGNPGQSLSSAYSEQPWFADAFQPFLNAPTKAPLDTHELVAMIAPRGLFIMENPHIGELSSKYGHVAALAGKEVYTALGAGDAISYVSNVQDGTHCAARPEWVTPLRNNIERFLKKTGNVAGVMNPYPSQTGDLTMWRDWTTPTLN
jgi:hypothetical protein